MKSSAGPIWVLGLEGLHRGVLKIEKAYLEVLECHRIVVAKVGLKKC
jgi:hypothetical protein